MQQDNVISELERLSQPAEQAQLQSDAELLSLYVDGGSRAAMEQLVTRYAPMVASVCRLTVADPASAEDAFQATFLVLLKSAKKIRNQSSVAAWLHGVAYRTASRIRKRGREQVTNQSSDDMIKRCDPADDPIAQLARQMELEALDRELEALPEKLRAPLVEHYLLGFTAPQIALRMELSTSAVEGRLRRGRRQLRTLLARRGISLSVLVAGSGLFQQHLQAVEATSWTGSFLNAYLPAGETPVGEPPIGEPSIEETVQPISTNPEVSSLVRGELSMISTSVLKAGIAASIVLIAGTLAVVAFDGPGSGGAGGRGNASRQLTMPFLEPNQQVIAQFATAPAAESGQVASGGMKRKTEAEKNEDEKNSQAPPTVLTWERPETRDGVPVWLAGGTASMRAIEENRAKLAEEVTYDFAGQPLHRALVEWSDSLGIHIYVNMSELDLLGIDPDLPITARGHSSLREGLRRICEPHELSYIVRDGGIEITSVDHADAESTMRFYDLSYVLPNSANVDALMNAIQQSVDPDSWLSAGGTSTLVMVGSMMVASAPDSTHQRIEILLINIAKMNSKNVERAIPLSTSAQGGSQAMGGFIGGGGGMF